MNISIIEKNDFMTINQLINDDYIVINETYVKGYYAPKFEILAIVWNGVFSDEEYKSLFHRVLDFASDHKVAGVYSDVRMQGKVSPEAREYFKKYITPIGDKLIKRVAVILDSSPFKLFYLNAITNFSGQRAKLFSDSDEALKYLIKK